MIMLRRTTFLTFWTTATLLAFFWSAGRASDIDIYTNNGEGVEPNVLIIFDNSGSMNEEIVVSFYDPAITYPNHLGIDPDKVYYYRRGSWNRVFKNSTADIPCGSARTALETEGFYNGRIRWSGVCGGRQTRYLRTGNYRNYLVEIGGSETRVKLDIAKEVVRDFVMTTYGIRMGAMVFNTSEGGKIHHDGGLDYSTYIRDMGVDDTDPNYANRETLTDALLSISADTWTPLAETLYEAGLYFKGENSYFNSGVTYTSPITRWCQKNYVIIITDGESTEDRNPILATIGDTDGDGHEPGGANELNYANNGSDYLDDVARHLYNTDLSPLEDQQNIVTYTIGFAVDTQLLRDTADNGRGAYYTANNARQLSEVFEEIVQEILEKSSSFVAPVVPISQMEKTTSGNKIYLALFKPSEDAFWKGNIKKFSLATEEIGSIDQGDVLDMNGNLATDDMGVILDSAVSFWGSTDPDGGDTEAGGVGEVLLDRITARSIYTYLGSSADLTHGSNLFNTTNITPEMVDLSGDPDGRDKIVDFVYGLDAYDEDADLNFAEKRHWILGSFLHSRPAVVHYDETTSVIFAGANDGMLHAFLDSDGSELWGFIPPDLLHKLKNLNGTVLEYFIDGAPRAAVIDNDADGVVEPADGDQVILVFGERRGGDYWYALDVTDPYSPQLLWDIHPVAGGNFEEMGQSWSTPVLGKVKIGLDDWLVVFLGGGYDTNQDDDPVVESDAVGRGIYAVDLLTGTLVWSSTYDAISNPSMIYSIPSTVAALDTNDSGYTDRLYVGDTGGQMWRCDIGDTLVSDWSISRLFEDSPASGRKIFYAPDVVLEHGFEMLFWGTGDRSNPKNETIVNRIYAVMDKNPVSPLTETSLVDVTENLIQDGTDLEKINTQNALDAHDGWYIDLDQNTGEKALAPSIVFCGVAYFTTFSPTSGSVDDPCYVGEGTARLYALNYMNASAVLDFDTSSEQLTRSDRSTVIGSAIPSGMVIAIIEGMGASYIGVGGGIYSSDLVNPRAILRIFWRQYW
jgi:type IV pilus assembly protein PilY1